MAERRSAGGDNLLVGLLVLAVVVSVGGVALNVALLESVKVPLVTVTGRVTSTSTVNLTQDGSAGITLTDNAIAFGSGYYNTGCQTGRALLFSGYVARNQADNTSYGQPFCWINTTVLLTGNGSGDPHVLQNSGTTQLNISAIGSRSPIDLFCGIGSNCSNGINSSIAAASFDAELNSCAAGLLTTGAYIGNATLNFTVGLCRELNYEDQGDSINITYNLTVPSGVTTGAKTYTITYEGLAV